MPYVVMKTFRKTGHFSWVQGTYTKILPNYHTFGVSLWETSKEFTNTSNIACYESPEVGKMVSKFSKTFH